MEVFCGVAFASVGPGPSVFAGDEEGKARLPVKTKPILVLADNDDVYALLACWRHRHCNSRLLARATPGKS